jgi:hypothetical protein
MRMGMIRTYSELSRLPSFEERFNYLKLGGLVGEATFGYDRYLNQEFYRSVLWKRARTHVIARDYGRDLGVEGYDIQDKVYVHHMNPMRPVNLMDEVDLDVINPEYLICVTHNTHNAIHYGDEGLLRRNQLVVRRPGDTKLW